MSLVAATRAAYRYDGRVSVQTAPSGHAVPLVTLRAHVAQGLTDDDVMLEDLGMAAEAWVEAYLGRAVLTQTREVTYDGAPCAVVLLPEPVTSVTSVTVYSDLDVASVVATTVYRLDNTGIRPRLVLKDGQLWPTDVRDAGSLVVRYVCGWAATAVPMAVRQAVQLLVGHWYEQRQYAAMSALTVIPMGVESLLMPYRVRAGVA